MMPTKFIFWLSIAAVAMTVAFLLLNVVLPAYLYFILSFEN